MSSTTDGNANTTFLFYDERRRPIGTIGPDPDGSSPRPRLAQRTSYTAGGQVDTQSVGTATGTDLNALNSIGVFQTTSNSRDTSGRLTKVSIAEGGQVYSVGQYRYDAVGRVDCVASRMNPAEFNMLPDACTPSTQSSGVPDRITQFGYDDTGRVLNTTSALGTSSASTERTSYTPNGLVSSVTDGQNNTTEYAMDGHDRVQKISYPLPATGSQAANTSGDFEQFTYDLNNNVLTRQLRGGGSLSFEYDGLNRTTVSHSSNGPDVNYGYDLLGRPTSISEVGGPSVTRTFDALGRLMSDGQEAGSLSYLYDPGGRQIRVTWNDGFYVTYDYDATDQMLAVRENGGAALATYGYDNRGRQGNLVYANGTASGYGFDSASRLQSLSINFPQPTNNLGLTFSYNAASQIVNRTSNNNAYAYQGYYAVNRSYSRNGLNQYTQAGPTTFDYDTRGNLARSGSDTFTYDLDDQLRSTGAGLSLTYDPLGRMTRYQVTPNQPSTQTRFVYDGGNIASEVSSTGALLRRYVYGAGDDRPLVWYEGSGTGNRRWLHADERGSIIAASTDGGAISFINKYDAYGIHGNSNPGGTPVDTNTGRFGFTGQAWLPELGAYNYKARIYSPTLGRFMQTDPIGYAAGMNLYNYVSGDPINLTDPFGLQETIADIIATGPRCGEGGRRACDSPRGPLNLDFYNPGFTSDGFEKDRIRITDARRNGSNPHLRSAGPLASGYARSWRIPYRCGPPPKPKPSYCANADYRAARFLDSAGKFASAAGAASNFFPYPAAKISGRVAGGLGAAASLGSNVYLARNYPDISRNSSIAASITAGTIISRSGAGPATSVVTGQGVDAIIDQGIPDPCS